MNLIEALLLGTVQGLTEFIPVSSSGHLVLMDKALGIQGGGLAFDVLLHVGTLFALVIYFHKDIYRLFTGLVSKNEYTNPARLMIIATIPAVIAGLLVSEYAEGSFRSVIIVSANLILVGLLMIWAENFAEKRKKQTSIEKISTKQALTVGFAQVAALVPGVSRSGSTITAGIFAGLDRVTATRFSFLLSAPIVFGAIVKVAFSGGLAELDMPAMSVVVGVMTSFLVGLFAIHFLIGYLSKHSLRVFAYYRIVLGIVVLAVALS
jgi:undecaprenyl-diphosphatase